jgi:succinate dehydrogenase / fumarate reductase cytochrome b subunit
MSDLAGTRGRKPRPQFRNIHIFQILQYRLPAPGIVSILHRVSGALMFLLGLPFALYLFEQSLTSEISFDNYLAIVGSIPGRLALLVLAWAYLHHFCAGIRYLLLDLHMGVAKEQARASARVTLGVSLALTALVALKIFGVF